jgi:malonate transporter MadM subunit
LHGSAIAILLGLVLSYVGGALTGGQKGLVDIPLLSGIGLLGGAMLRDFAIVATAFGVSVDEASVPGSSVCWRCLWVSARHLSPGSVWRWRSVIPTR